MTVKRRALWLAALGAAALAGCTAAEREAAPVNDPTLAADSPVALAPYSAEGDAMAVAGTLALEDGCLYLRNGQQRLLPVFPWPGTRWEPATRTIVIFERDRYRVGERIEAGGGVTEGGAVQDQLVMPRPACDTARTAFLYFGTRPEGAGNADTKR